jgi:hypothetical protein
MIVAGLLFTYATIIGAIMALATGDLHWFHILMIVVLPPCVGIFLMAFGFNTIFYFNLKIKRYYFENH